MCTKGNEEGPRLWSRKKLKKNYDFRSSLKQAIHLFCRTRKFIRCDSIPDTSFTDLLKSLATIYIYIYVYFFFFDEGVQNLVPRYEMYLNLHADCVER
jgi:hypothetical protein